MPLTVFDKKKYQYVVFYTGLEYSPPYDSRDTGGTAKVLTQKLFENESELKLWLQRIWLQRNPSEKYVLFKLVPATATTKIEVSIV